MDALDWFIGSCLCDGCVWDSPRTSDGISGIERVLERGPDTLRVSGRIWEIDQTLHEFWVELQPDGESDRFAWFLFFDVAEDSARRARTALSSHDRAEDISWSATLAGEATVQDGALTIVPGSTRVLLRDMPEREQSANQKRRRPRRT
jgi:hypothetical protein